MAASLSPVTGTAEQVWPLVRTWIDGGDAPLLVRTSGSAGEPKDVQLSKAATLASAELALRRLGGPGQWVVTLPVTGVGGLQTLVRSAVAGFDPVIGKLGSVAGAKAPRVYTSIVPTQLYRLDEQHDLCLLSRFDAVLIGGAALDPELAERARDAGVKLVRTYGMTETSGGCVYDGVALDGVDVRVVDGEIQLAGPVLFDGYRDGPVIDRQATAAVFDDGWFRTGDVGSLVSGRLQVTGRRDDVINSGGLKIPLPAVTAAVRSLDGVRDAIVLGHPDPEWGMRAVAFIVPDNAVCLLGLEVEVVRDGVHALGLDRSWAPREVVLVDSLPLLGGGKIDRQSLLRSLRS